IPTVIAVARRCQADVLVLIVNLLLGWTVIGWVAALGMAAGSQRRGAPPSEPPGTEWRTTR
ncbi:MAG TPA: superinfection immunity protein, partial [Candidatus Angelobacter sp.]|nr:superinfection immunity protein [Candidatus Angelobacter sp.]